MSRLLPIVALAAGLASPPPAAADCMPDGSRSERVQLEVALLGEVTDLLGHRASFYFDTGRGVVIGPVDHDVWQGAPARPRSLPAKVAPGTVGTLVMTARRQPGSEPVTGGGQLESFKPSKRTASLDAAIARIDDAFVLGLLAPTSAKAEVKVEALRADASRRDELVLAGHGILYAARGPRAQALLAPIRLRDLGGARLDRIATLRDGGLPALATLAPDPDKGDWTDYLPELAAAWIARKDLGAAYDALLLGRDRPNIPIEIDESFGMRHGCGPSRREVRGPFVGPGELTTITLRDLVRAKDARFAAKLEPALATTTSGTAQFVVGFRGTTALVIGSGSSITAVDLGGKVAVIGTQLAYVAHGSGPHAQFPIAHLELGESPISDAGKASLVNAALGANGPKLTELLKAAMRSGSLPHDAGLALATLFELAGKVSGWKLADARTYAWSLPGNTYASPQQWAQTWSEILTRAIRYAPDLVVADEIERALPVIIAGFARAPGNKTVKIPADVVRKLAIDVATDIAARRLIAKDLAGAARIVALAAGPISAIAGKTPVEPERTRDSNYQTRITTLEVLIASLRGTKAPQPSESERSFGMDLFGHMVRPYTAQVRAPWIKALIAAGYPARP